MARRGAAQGQGRAARRGSRVERGRRGGGAGAAARPLGLHVDLRQLLAHGEHGSLEDELGQVGAAVALRVLGEHLEVDLGAHLHAARLDVEDVQPARVVGHGDRDLEVEAAEAAQRRLEHVGPVSRSHHDHLRAGLEPVEQREQLRDDPSLHLALCFVPTCQRVG